MAYFNPNRVDFNYNTNMIDAVGEVGRSLWDIYKDNVTKNQNQMKIDEAKRSNLANEGINQNKLNETINYHNKDLELREKSLQATNDFRVDQRNFWEWQKKEAARAKRDSTIQRQNEVAERQRIADQKAYQQDLEQDQLFTMLGGQYPQESQNWSPFQFRAYRNAYLSPQAIKNREAAGKESGETTALKNAIAKTQSSFNKGLNELAALDRLVYAANSAGGGDGISTLGGGWDTIAYHNPNLSESSRNYRAALSTYQGAYADNQKGQGKFNYENMGERLTPGLLGADTAAAEIVSRRNQILSEMYQTAIQAKEQGYRGADEMLEQVRSLAVDPSKLEKILYGKERINSNFGAGMLFNNLQNVSPENDIANMFLEKKKTQSKQNNDDPYGQADEYGIIYLN
ncbi:hypothetical protein [Campylobacter sp. RM16192]|uniref:hypothetical protein n=1 Tax=Campylobacter sp. RM16192 TaxID=1660080 RepID=UPI0014512F20|nr:hypothetical protein [Campylobacter sp. RM16192]QCD52806.1 hypothetical protein CDOMC_1199 [Campylobacter sp. RM16192]